MLHNTCAYDDMALNIVKSVSYVSDNVVASQSLLEYANQNRNEGFFNDVTIKVSNQCFPASRMVLSYFSCVFERMFKVEMKERYEESVEIKQVDEKTMKVIIEYIYTGHIDIDNENVMDVLEAADYFQLDELTVFSFNFLISILTSDTWFAILTANSRYQNKQLKEHLCNYLSNNFIEISQSDQFLQLSKDDFVFVIENLDRKQVEEVLIYKALVSWTKHNEVLRKPYFPNLFNLIALRNLPGNFVQKIVSKEELIIGNKECSKLVLQAFSRILEFSQKLNSKIISFGGKNTLQSCVKVFETDVEDQMHTKTYSALPIPLQDFQAIKFKDFVFCIGGHSSNSVSNKVWKMKIQKQNEQWHEIASLNMARDGFGAAVFNDAVIVAGGRKDNAKSKDKSSSVELYLNVVDEWRNISPMKQARYAFALVGCNDFLYAVGGTSDGDDLASVERIQNLQGAWEYVKAMQIPRRWHAAVNCKGYIYVIGGIEGGKRLKSVVKYDPNQNKWSNVCDMKIERSGVAACVINDKIFVVGGRAASGTIVKTIDCYDPSKNLWETVGTTDLALERHSVLSV